MPVRILVLDKCKTIDPGSIESYIDRVDAQAEFLSDLLCREALGDELENLPLS